MKRILLPLLVVALSGATILAQNVGIGNTSPKHKLHVGVTNSDNQVLTLRGYSNDPASWKGGAAFGYSSATVIMGQLNGVAQIGGHNANLTGWSNLALNSGGGNVGVGTTIPAQKLDVNGQIAVQGVGVITSGGNDVYANIRVIRNTSSTLQDGMYINYGGTGTTNNHIKFYTPGTTQRMAIEDDGRVQINALAGANTRNVMVDASGYLNATGTPSFDDLELRGIKLSAFLKNAVHGGGTLSWNGTTFSWTERIIVIPTGDAGSEHFNTAVWSGNTTPTSINIGSWEVAYMRPSDADYTTNGGSYNPLQVAPYGSYDPQMNDIIIAVKNGDNGMLYTAWGVILAPGESYSETEVGYNRNMTMRNNSYTLYGPNSSWGAYLEVGGNGRTTTNASVAATNGNLHIDARDGSYATYINWYSQNNTYINGQGGNVGIGNSSPGHPLHVTTGNSSWQARFQNGAANVYLAHGGSYGMHINTGGTNSTGRYALEVRNASQVHMYVRDDGNVGVGNNAPADKLHVSGDIRFTGDLATDQIGRISPIYIRGTGLNHNANRVLKISSNQVYNGGGRGLNLTIINKSDHSVASSTTYDTYGSTAASDQLAAALAGMNYNQIGVLTSYDAWEGAVTANLNAQFRRLGLHKALMTPGGSRRPYAAIFEPPSAGVSAARAEEILYTADGNAPYAEMRGWLMDGGFMTSGDKPNSLTNNIGTITAITVDEAGNVGIGTETTSQKLTVAGRVKSNGINETSDVRMKKNIEGIGEVLPLLLQLRGVTYDWRTEEFPQYGFDDQQQLGLIAQELEPHFPQVVYTDENGYKSVDYSHLVPVLIEAIKEQQQIIDQKDKKMDARVSELENKLDLVLKTVNLQGEDYQCISE